MANLDVRPELLQYEQLFGLIGYPISHSFSQKYFTEKFEREGLTDYSYQLFPLETIELFPKLIQNYPNLKGLNVTIPYKQAVMPYLDKLDEGASAIGAVNVIKVENGTLTGSNSDAYGFEQSLLRLFEESGIRPARALVLGTGGAAKAVQFVLRKNGIVYLTVSRNKDNGDLTYGELEEAIFNAHMLIINTTPLGMSPNIGSFPNIPYHCISKGHLLYDLVYNPEMTAFLEKGRAHGAIIMNGLSMLYGQAERAWAIWNA